ncbi:MAG: hypothetical protein ACKVOK_15910 [Flavobacteriales bacterium]
MKRKIILIASILAGLFILLFGYANLRFVNPSTKLEPIHARTFEVAGIDETNKEAYESFLRSSNYVRAVALHPENATLGLTYYYKSINDEDLMQFLSWEGKIKATPKAMSTSGPECPVQGITALWEKINTALRVVR